MRNPVSIHNQASGDRIETEWLNIRETVFPLFEAEYKGGWYPVSGDFDHMRIDVRPKQSRKIGKPADRPVKPLNVVIAPRVADEVTYEQWKAGKDGIGPKYTAPRGMGTEWAARLYIERAISRARYFATTHHTKRQLRTGSRAHRRMTTVNKAHSDAWHFGIVKAEEIYHEALKNGDNYRGYWQIAKELVQDAFGYTSYLLELAGN
jgi:hypothetical protein